MVLHMVKTVLALALWAAMLAEALFGPVFPGWFMPAIIVGGLLWIGIDVARWAMSERQEDVPISSTARTLGAVSLASAAYLFWSGTTPQVGLALLSIFAVILLVPRQPDSKV